MLIFLTILSWAFLVPLYYFGDAEVETDMEKIGIAHVLNNEQLLVAPLVVFTLITVLLIYFISQYIQHAIQLAISSDYPDNVVQVYGIPKSCPYKYAQRMFDKIIRAYYGDLVYAAIVIPDYAQAYVADKKAKSAERKLIHYKEYLK